MDEPFSIFAHVAQRKTLGFWFGQKGFRKGHRNDD